MTPFELNNTLDSMVCLVDTREQDTPRFRARLAQMDCSYRREKLDFGDYSAEFVLPNKDVLSLKNQIAIERKMDLSELCHCFCQDRKRFRNEFERAKTVGAKIYLIIENADWEKIYSGQYRSQMTSQALVASILAWLSRYNCQLIFCSAKTSGKIIHDILFREGKELLEKMP